MVIKDAAYRVLGAMLDLIAAFPLAIDDDQVAAMDVRLHQMVDAEFTRLHDALTGPCRRLQAALAGEHAALLHRELDRWARSAPGGWLLINAADPCGT